MNLSYLRKADEQTRRASLGTPGLADPDPAGPPVTDDERRQRLLRAAELPDEGQSLAEVEELVAAALAPTGGAQ